MTTARPIPGRTGPGPVCLASPARRVLSGRQSALTTTLLHRAHTQLTAVDDAIRYCRQLTHDRACHPSRGPARRRRPFPVRLGRYCGSRLRPGVGLAPVPRLPMQARASATAPARAAAVSVQCPAAVASAACAAVAAVSAQLHRPGGVSRGRCWRGRRGRRKRRSDRLTAPGRRRLRGYPGPRGNGAETGARGAVRMEPPKTREVSDTRELL